MPQRPQLGCCLDQLLRVSEQASGSWLIALSTCFLAVASSYLGHLGLAIGLLSLAVAVLFVVRLEPDFADPQLRRI